MNQELHEETKNQKISTNSASYPSFQEKVKVKLNNGMELESTFTIYLHILDGWNIVREIFIVHEDSYCVSMVEIYFGGNYIRYTKLFRKSEEKTFHTVGTMQIEIERTDLSSWWTNTTTLIEVIKTEGVLKTYRKIFDDLKKLLILLEL